MVKNIRFFLRLAIVFFKKHYFLISCFTILGFSLFSTKSYWLKLIPQNSSIRRIGIVGNHTLNNPPSEIQNLISIGLTQLTASGEATPAAAVSWEATDSGKLYTFYLKKDLVWHDNEPFVSKDINYNFRDVQVDTLGSHIIQFRLKEPFAPFLTLISQPLFKKGLIGLGEYKIEKIKIDGKFIKEILLTKNRPVQKKTKIIFKIYPTQNSLLTAFKLGEIDEAKNLTDISQFENWPNLKITPHLSLTNVVALLYNNDYSFLIEKSVRQSLTYTIPEKLNDNVPAYSPIHPSSWTYNENIKKYPFNLENAQKLLSKSEMATEQAKLKITLSTMPEFKDIAEKIAQSWQKINIQTKVKVESVIPPFFEALILAIDIPSDPDQYLFWHSTQTYTNLSNYKSPKVDKLLESGRHLINKSERREKYFLFQKAISEDVPAAFLFYPTLYDIQTSRMSPIDALKYE